MIGWTAIFSKGFAPLLFIAAGAIAGIGMQQRIFNQKPLPCPQCPQPPACVCPPQTAVSVQPFDVQKIKNLRAFTYQPEYNGVITVAGVDSTVMKKYINEAVQKAFDGYTIKLPPLPVVEDQSKRKRR